MNISIILNGIIFVLAAISTVWMVSGITLSEEHQALTAGKWKAFQFFTVDSNVLAGIVSLIAMHYELSNPSQPALWVWALKLMGTTGVTLTFLVTAFFLVPHTKNGRVVLYQDANLFMHLITPILSVITFVFFERQVISSGYAVYGVIPVALYGIYYIGNCLKHIQDGKIPMRYDFYGFFAGGSQTVLPVFCVLLCVTFAISFVLTILN